MPLRAQAPLGAPCWVDLQTSDPERSIDFYGSLFGWTADRASEEFGGYVNFSKDGQLVAGAIGTGSDSPMADRWTVYLAVADAAVVTDAAAAHGGQVMMPAMAVMDLGSMALLADPGEALIGLWQPGTHKGFGVLGETGTPNWFELLTRSHRDVVAFYRDVFGWDVHAMSDTDELRYTTLGEGDGALAGIMDGASFLPDGVPSKWSIYFGMTDTDATLAKVAELGGSVAMGPNETPFGRLAQVVDSTGATFNLMEPPPPAG